MIRIEQTLSLKRKLFYVTWDIVNVGKLKKLEPLAESHDVIRPGYSIFYVSHDMADKFEDMVERLG